MWTALPQFLLRYWQLALIGTLSGLLWIQTNRLGSEKEDHRVTKVGFEMQRKQAQLIHDQQKKEYDDALTRSEKHTATLVEQAEANAWANYVKRYGSKKSVAGPSSCAWACGVLHVPTDPATGTSTNESAGKPDGASGEFVPASEDFVRACGRDAARLNGWIDLCNDAKCEVIKE